MEFLTLLIALVLLQLWGSGGPIQQDGWFDEITDFVSGQTESSYYRLSAIVVLPCLLVLLVLAGIESLLFGLLSLLVYLSILLYSLGRGEFSENIQRYLNYWNSGALDQASKCVAAMSNTKLDDSEDEIEAIDAGNIDIQSTQISLHEKVRVAIIYQGFERWFAVIFWFLLLGPAGALAYRLCHITSGSVILNNNDRQLALRALHYLDWIPARLLALAFALTGNFVNGFNQCWQSLWDDQSIPELLDCSALAAISGVNEIRSYPDDSDQITAYGREEILALEALLSRSVICWVVVVALIAVFV